MAALFGRDDNGSHITFICFSWGTYFDVPAYRNALETHFGYVQKEVAGDKIRGRISLAAAGAAFGIVLFDIYASLQQKMTDYLFMRTHFVFFDETFLGCICHSEKC